MAVKTQSKDQRKRPVFLIVFSVLMIIPSFFHSANIYGMGIQPSLFLIQMGPLIFIETFILRGILSFFVGIGMLMLNSTARIVAVLLAISNLVSYIKFVLTVPVPIGLLQSSVIKGIQQDRFIMLANLLVLALYEIIFIFYMTRSKIKERFHAGSVETISVLIRSGFLGVVFVLVAITIFNNIKGTIEFRKEWILSNISKLAKVDLAQQKKEIKQRLNPEAKIDSTKNKGLRVDGILYDKDNPSVMIDSKIYCRNDSISSGIIVDISQGEVIIKFPDKKEAYGVGELIQPIDSRTKASLDKKPAISSGERAIRGTPRDDFLIFHQAIFENDVRTAKEYVSKEMLINLTEKADFKEDNNFLQVLSYMFPENLEVIGESLENSKAIIKATAKVKSDVPIKFVNKGGVMRPEYFGDKIITTEMIKEDGRWKVSAFSYVWK